MDDIKQKRVYVSTYCVASSYGSILQSYALKTVLEDNGFLSCIIVKEQDRADGKGREKRKKISIKRAIKELYNKINAQRILSYNSKNRLFIKQHFSLYEYRSYDALESALFDSNIFLAGSDQIFNPSLCNPAFFLDFAPKTAKRISYAASMGSLKVPSEKETEFARLLKNFDYLSFRERDAAEVAQKYAEKKISVHIDPTFLLHSDEWKPMEKEYPINGKFILLYTLYWDRRWNNKLKKMHQATGLPVVCIGNSLGKYHQKSILDAGVEQFLWLIDRAEYVITSSFHGAALSIILNKKVSILVNPQLPSRMKCLSETLDFPIIPIEQLANYDIDYDHINQKIKYEKERSVSYLKQVLSDE